MRAIIPILLIAWMVCPSQAGAQDLGGRSLAGLDRLQEGTRFRVSSADSDWRNGNADARPIEPGETLTVADIEGPGRITHIWFTISADDPHYGRSVTLRMYWDGQEEPAVESPLGDFFAVGHGLKRNVNSLPVQVSSEGRAYNCYWPMPFRKSARITVTNDSAEHKVHALFWYVDGVKLPSLPEDTAYFHAQYRQEFPCVGGRNYLIFDGEGAGHYVGTVLSVHMNSASWFGEGDDFFYIDGEQEPSLRGTGTEDYFCDAWGFRVFSSLYHGVPALEGRDAGDRLSVYRFHILDPIPFRKTFKFQIEHWPWVSPIPNTGRGYYSSLGFWYQKTVHAPWPRLERIASNGPWAPDKGRWHVPGALEAEDLAVIGFTGGKGPDHGPKAEKILPNLSGDHMLRFDTGGDGGFSLSVPAEKAGGYTVKVYYARAPEFGVVSLSVNGRRVGMPVDTYLKKKDLTRPLWPPKEIIIKNVALKKGQNKFTFSVNGKHPKAEGFQIGLDCVVLTPWDEQ